MSEDLRFTATIIGGEQVKQRFLDLAGGLRARLRTTLSTVAAAIRDAVAAATPRKAVGGGAGAASWRANLRETNDKISVSIAPTAFYLKFLEFGVVNHGGPNNRARLGAGQLKKLSVRRGLVQRVRELRSAGEYRIQPHPFAEPVAAEMLPAAQEEINATVSQALQES